MSYDPRYGPPGPPDVSRPISGFPPPAPAGPPPISPAYGPVAPLSPYPGPVPNPPGDPGARPAVVGVAVFLTFAGVLLAFIGTLLTHLFAQEVTAQTSGLGEEFTKSMETLTGAWTFVAAGVNLLAGAGASACAIFALRGSNGARVTLCVLCGTFAGWKLMCGGYNAMWLFIPEAQSAYGELGDAMYLVYGAVAVDVLLMLLGIVIVILLLLGPANRFFNPPRVPAAPGY